MSGPVREPAAGWTLRNVGLLLLHVGWILCLIPLLLAFTGCAVLVFVATS